MLLWLEESRSSPPAADCNSSELVALSAGGDCKQGEDEPDRSWGGISLAFSGRSQRGPNEHRDVAALRLGWLRPARLYEPQKHKWLDTANKRRLASVYSERQRN